MVSQEPEAGINMAALFREAAEGRKGHGGRHIYMTFWSLRASWLSGQWCSPSLVFI